MAECENIEPNVYFLRRLMQLARVIEVEEKKKICFNKKVTMNAIVVCSSFAQLYP